MRYRDGRWPRYVSVAQRRLQAERMLAKLGGRARPAEPIVIEGRPIARTFWGKAWCTNLERYSDFSNRLPRGRSYLRSGAVVDLRLRPGKVAARVAGSRLYGVEITVAKVPEKRWAAICADCAGAVDSLVELLQGRFPKRVMERVCRPDSGLFPAPNEIGFSCSCPDWASMCKHVAAVLYGVGARLDAQPELLFELRKVDAQDLIAKVGKALPGAHRGVAGGKLLSGEGLSELFGLDLGELAEEPRAAAKERVRSARGAGATAKRRSSVDDDLKPRASKNTRSRKSTVERRKKASEPSKAKGRPTRPQR